MHLRQPLHLREEIAVERFRARAVVAQLADIDRHHQKLPRLGQAFVPDRVERAHELRAGGEQAQAEGGLQHDECGTRAGSERATRATGLRPGRV